MAEALALSKVDRQDLDRVEAMIQEVARDLDEWHEARRGHGGQREGPLDLERLHRRAREVANALGRMRRRQAKRREARERRGSALEG